MGRNKLGKCGSHTLHDDDDEDEDDEGDDDDDDSDDSDDLQDLCIVAGPLARQTYQPSYCMELPSAVSRLKNHCNLPQRFQSSNHKSTSTF